MRLRLPIVLYTAVISAFSSTHAISAEPIDSATIFVQNESSEQERERMLLSALSTVNFPPPSITIDNKDIAANGVISTIAGFSGSGVLSIELTGKTTIAGTAYGFKFSDNITDSYILHSEKIETSAAQLWLANAFGETGTKTVNVNTKFTGGISKTDGTAVTGSIWGGTMSSNRNITGNVYTEFASADIKLDKGSGSLSTNAVIYGGSYSGSISGNVTLVISAGQYGTVLGESKSFIYGGNTKQAINGSTNVHISGGTFMSDIAAGGQDADANVIGGTNITISGGILNGSIYGGGNSGNVGSATVAGNTNVTIDGTDAALRINGNIYGGSVKSGNVFGDTNVTLKNFTNSTLSNISSGSIFHGGSAETGTVSGERKMLLDNVSGTFSNQLKNFDRLIVQNGSNVVLANADSSVKYLTVEQGTQATVSEKGLIADALLTGGGTTILSGAGEWAFGLGYTNQQGTLDASGTGVISSIHIGQKGGIDSVSMSSLTLNAGSGISFDMGNTLASGNDSLSIATMMSNGTIDIYINALTLENGTYNLILGNLSGVDSFNLASNPLSGRTSWTLNDSTYKTDGKLTLTVVSGLVKNLVWNTPSDGVWSAGGTSKPWNESGTSTPSNFENIDTVTFTTLSDISHSEVRIDGDVAPTAITVSGTTDYTITGSGSIIGTTSLTKEGANTLEINTANTYNGNTLLKGGLVVMGNTGALGTGSIIFDGGSLKYGTGIISDISTRLQATAGNTVTVDLNGTAQTWSNMAVTSVKLTNSSASGGSLTLVSAASGNLTLDIGTGATLNQLLARNVAKLSGNGYYNLSSTGGRIDLLDLSGFSGKMTLGSGRTGYTVFGAANSADKRFALDIQVQGNDNRAIIMTAGGTNTYYLREISGTGAIRADWGGVTRNSIDLEMDKDNAWAGEYTAGKADTRLGSFTVGSVEGQNHTLSLSSSRNALSSANATLIVNNAVVRFTDDGKWNSNVTINEKGTVVYAGNSVEQTSVISGNGTLAVKTGNAAKVVTISGQNTGFTGKTNLESGTLKVTNSNALGSSSVTIKGGTFDANNQTLANNISIESGRIFNLGSSGAAKGITVSQPSTAGTIEINQSFLSIADMNLAANQAVILGNGSELTVSGNSTFVISAENITNTFARTGSSVFSVSGDSSLVLGGTLTLDFTADAFAQWTEEKMTLTINLFDLTQGTVDLSSLDTIVFKSIGTIDSWMTLTQSDNAYYFEQLTKNGSVDIYFDGVPPSGSSPVPEPSSAGLAIMGMAGLLLRRKRRQCA